MAGLRWGPESQAFTGSQALTGPLNRCCRRGTPPWGQRAIHIHRLSPGARPITAHAALSPSGSGLAWPAFCSLFRCMLPLPSPSLSPSLSRRLSLFPRATPQLPRPLVFKLRCCGLFVLHSADPSLLVFFDAGSTLPKQRPYKRPSKEAIGQSGARTAQQRDDSLSQYPISPKHNQYLS